jgi:hypothetical protein
MKLKESDKLDWDMQAHDDRIVLIVTKVENDCRLLAETNGYSCDYIPVWIKKLSDWSAVGR